MVIEYVCNNFAHKEKLFRDTLTMEEESLLEKQFDLSISAMLEGCIAATCQHWTQIQTMVSQKKPLTSSELAEIDRIDQAGYENWLKSLHQVLCLDDTRDLMALFHLNLSRINQFIYAIWFQDCKELVFLAGLRQHSTLDHEVVDAWFGLNIQLSYECFYSTPWASNSALEEEHSTLYKQIGNWITLIKRNALIKPKIIYFNVLLTLLYDTTEVGSQNVNRIDISKAEKIQAMYIQNLYKYLKTKSRNISNQLHRALMIIFESKRMHDLSLNRLQLDDTEPLDIL